MNMLKIPGISRKYMRLAATYRRMVKDAPSGFYEFTVDKLIECYQHETYGGPTSKNNGYVQGKWAKDLTVVQWIEDIRKGDACKAEFYTVTNKWWAEKALKNVIVNVPFFPFNTSSEGLKKDFESIKERSDHPVIIDIDRAIMNLAEQYPTLSGFDNVDSVRFYWADMFFNVVGSGHRTYEDLICKYAWQCDKMIGSTKTLDDIVLNQASAHKAPYPNFEKQYSLVWTLGDDINRLPVSWIKTAIWFYVKCREFFMSERVVEYHGAEIVNAKKKERFLERVEQYINSKGLDVHNPAHFVRISAMYLQEYTGDLEAFMMQRWEQEHARILSFIDETIAYLRSVNDSKLD